MRSWRTVVAAIARRPCPLSARAEVGELKIPLGAGGFGFLPLHVMQRRIPTR